MILKLYKHFSQKKGGVNKEKLFTSSTTKAIRDKYLYEEGLKKLTKDWGMMGLPSEKITSNIQKAEIATASPVIGNESPIFENLTREQKSIANSQASMKVAARGNGENIQERGVKKVRGAKSSQPKNISLDDKKQEIYNRLSDSRKRQYNEWRNNNQTNITTQSTTILPNTTPTNTPSPQTITSTTTPTNTPSPQTITSKPTTAVNNTIKSNNSNNFLKNHGGKIALGSAAAIGLGTLAYNHYKNKQ